MSALLVQKVTDALKVGAIRAIGGIVYDTQMQPLCSTSDLASIRHLIPFERIDAGGSPTWQLKSVSTPHPRAYYDDGELMPPT